MMDQIYSSTSGMLRTNLRGQIRQTPLPKWKALLPLFEAVMNSFQAIHDSDTEQQHKITISVERENGLLTEEDQPIVGFKITDTGIGFDDDNFESFNTAFSEHKVDRGGKGLGRFMWLKAFETVDIISVFSTHDPGEERQLWSRNFKFDVNYDPENAAATRIREGAVGTIVKLGGFKKQYKEHCPLQVEKLAQRLAEHFILVLMQPDCPKVEIHDQGFNTSLNNVFRDDFKDNSAASSFNLHGRTFKINGFRISAPGASKHRLIYAANSRSVTTEMLDQHIANLSSRLVDEDGESFVYLAVVQGNYLNEKVNNFRTDFEIKDSIDDELELELVEADIKRAEIRDRCIEFIKDDLSSQIEDLNRIKIEKLRLYVRADAPQYKPLMRYVIDFVGDISPNATKIEMEIALHKELHKREVNLKRESKRILTQAAKLDDYEDYNERFSRFMERSNELGAAALAQYVMHRKIVLELFGKALSADKRTEKYPLEAAVHNIVFPMHSTDQETLYSQQNMWLIDERLTYHSFIASDKALNSLEGFQADSKKRPDLFIFDRKITFSEKTEDGMPINSLVVVEFKRPRRKGYTDTDNPMDQVLDQISDIRTGQFLDENGRQIPVANEKIPAFAYVVCDITDSLKTILIKQDLTPTPDGLMYYGYHKNLGIYQEVIDYGKLLSDAKRRNRIFFEKLNIMADSF